MLPRVLISGKMSNPQNYVQALRLSGMEPVLLEPGLSVDRFDALLVPGGGDVHPRFYGEEITPLCGKPDEELDQTEIDLILGFASAGRPIFGICRGCQVINVAFGGTLVQHIESVIEHAHTPQGDSIHATQVRPDSFVEAVYGPGTIVTNSAHHQCVRDLAPGFVDVQRTADHVIEAISHKTLPIWGVQWHPERMAFAHRRKDTVDGALIFTFFRRAIG